MGGISTSHLLVFTLELQVEQTKNYLRELSEIEIGDEARESRKLKDLFPF